LAVYLLLESDPEAAYALSLVLLVVCVGVLVAMRDTERERTKYLEKLGLDLETLKKVIGC
jgi:ABC-type Fe3+ transport system permease subunit